MTPWNNLSYQKIEKASFNGNTVEVIFENGDTVKIEKERLVPFDINNIDWDKLYSNAFEIIIPAIPNNVEIPWDKLRVITDKQFAKHLAEKSEEQSKLIGTKVKRLREKKGISSKELAERASVTAQTISRIEQGHTDVSFITLRKILAAMGYSLKDLANQEAELEMENSKRSFSGLMKRLSQAGIDSNLLTRKIIPKKIISALNAYKSNEPSLLLDEASSYVTAVFGWPANEIWSNSNLVVKHQPAAMAFFKKPSNANQNQIKAYSHYAYYLAKVVLKAYPPLRDKLTYPGSLEEFKDSYFRQNKEIELTALLEFVWSLGICILPLNDTGVFHGASWNIEGRHVIVLKQVNKSHARWIYDLLHELYHVFVHLAEENTSVVEVEELGPFSNNESTEELEANAFASQVIFGDRAETLAELCVNTAKWDLKNLSKAVIQVAKKEKVRPDFLSNYMAFRLSLQGENWWSSAIKMQITQPDPFTIASEFLKNKLQIQNLNPIDFNLLNTAISIQT